jgi:hypothetical protein
MCVIAGFQARIGCMDGMFVAYHNTQELFGFEYIPLSDIDKCVSGSTHFAQTAFNVSTRVRICSVLFTFLFCVLLLDTRYCILFVCVLISVLYQLLRDILSHVIEDMGALKKYPSVRLAFAAASNSTGSWVDIFAEGISEESSWEEEAGLLRAVSGNMTDEQIAAVDLRKYRLSLNTFVNGKPSVGQLHFQEVCIAVNNYC